MNLSRPVLRYFGGKFLLAPWIIQHFPDHQVYVEPYGGAASVLMRKPRAYAEIYNDIDEEIVSLFMVLREHSNELRYLLEKTPFARAEFQKSYDKTQDPIERARRMLVRSFMGFGANAVCGGSSGFRANSNRSGSTPAHDWMNYPAYLEAFAERLSGVVIENRPALQVMSDHDSPLTLHYLDPPYLQSLRKPNMYRHEMSAEEHAQLIDHADSMKGFVFLSAYESDQI